MGAILQFLVLVGLAIRASAAFSCTGILVEGSPSVLVATNMDWTDGRGLIFVNKRDVAKDSILIDTERPLHWVSRFSSLTLAQIGRDFPTLGVNERGLAVQALALPSVLDPPSPSSGLPTVNFVQWVQFILDRSANLHEAQANARGVRVDRRSYWHYLVCDATSMCAVFEYLDGRLKVHQGRDLPYSSLANSRYDDSLQYLNARLEKHPPSEIISSSSFKSLDRFARAAVWSKGFGGQLPNVGYAWRALHNVAENQPGATTYWSTVLALRTLTVHLRTLDAPATKSIDLAVFAPGCRSGVAMLDVNAPIGGDVSADFVPYNDSLNRRLIEALDSRRVPRAEKNAIESYVGMHTRCLEAGQKENLQRARLRFDP